MIVQSRPKHHIPIHDTWVLAQSARVVTQRRTRATARARADAARVGERNVGKALAQARIEAHISQRELAQMANVPMATVRDIENASKRFPARATLQALSAVLGVTLPQP